MVDEFRPQITAALKYANGTHTFDDIKQGVADGRFQLWPGRDSVIVTEVLQSPRQRTLHFFLAGGDLGELEVMTPLVIEWGKTQGCTRAALIGRRGWARTFLAGAGWQQTGVLMETQL